MATWLSPTGTRIRGTLELVTGVALILDIGQNGEPEYEGETEIFWDEQITLAKDGKPIYVDEDGEEWTFDQLKKESAPDEPIQAPPANGG